MGHSKRKFDGNIVREKYEQASCVLAQLPDHTSDIYEHFYLEVSFRVQLLISPAFPLCVVPALSIPALWHLFPVYHVLIQVPGCQEEAKWSFNSVQNENFLDLSKLKAFADDKINVTEKLKLLFISMENIVGKGKNAGYQHFLLFPQCFQQASFSRSLKVTIVW